MKKLTAIVLFISLVIFSITNTYSQALTGYIGKNKKEVYKEGMQEATINEIEKVIGIIAEEGVLFHYDPKTDIVYGVTIIMSEVEVEGFFLNATLNGYELVAKKFLFMGDYRYEKRLVGGWSAITIKNNELNNQWLNNYYFHD